MARGTQDFTGTHRVKLVDDTLVDLGTSGNPIYTSVTGAGSGGTSSVDQATFTSAVSAGTAAMGEFNGKQWILSCDTNRNLNVNIQSGTITSSPVESGTCSTNAINTVGAGNVTVLASNSNRKMLILQNIGTTVIYVLYGGGAASATNFTFILPAGGSSKDGSSNVVRDIMWQGAVQCFSSAAGGQVSAQELT
jgi:hypothetical protein